MELRPVANVARDGDRFVATSTEPWLAVGWPDAARYAGRFVEITYRASLWDEPVRPVLRFWTTDETHVDRIAAGPVAGAAIWIGRVPSGTRRLDISPTNRVGIFGFRIERIRPLPWLAVVALGLRRQPGRVRSALLTRLIGWAAESDANLAWAVGAIPIASFERWWAARGGQFLLPLAGEGGLRVSGGRMRGDSRRGVSCSMEPPAPDIPHPTLANARATFSRLREKEFAHLDPPRLDWSAAIPIRVLIGDGEPAARQRTLESLAAQVFANWTIGPGEAPVPGDGLICWVRPGDVLDPIAFAYADEQAHRHPPCRVFYADAVRIDARGKATPSFQPGWSPRLHASRPLRDTLIFVRDLQSWSQEEQRLFRHEGEVAPSVLSRLAPAQVRPLRRLLVETARATTAPIPNRAPVPARSSRVSVIIPTRDHPALLRRVIASIRSQAGASPPQIVIVDNGSVGEPAQRLLAELAGMPDTLVLPHPRPFNFSGMCNAAAVVADGDVLVFLNDDTEIWSLDGLDRLAMHAADPSIGAVGAKLVFPDGRLQHVGIVVGMGGSAGHFGAFAEASDPGWAGRNTALHEVSAVTGACLAVAREKFRAVGGFDEAHLPVELGDVDLCLKLNARGWQAVVDPAIVVMHEESASRGGATFRRLGVYETQRAIFVERWRHVLRDDPFFHPALSLYSVAPALA